MPKKEEAKRVGVWLRVSHEDQVKGESPETHEKRGRLYAEAKGWEVAEVYRLDAVSGKTVKEHPETKRMLADIKRGHIKGLIFSKLARLARNTKELLEFADMFRDCAADLISLAEAIDTSTPAGRLFYTIIAAMAQWEREEISARVAASVPIRAKMGKLLGGAPPFGYQKKDGRMIPEPTEAAVRKLMYELFKEHRRKKKVARVLNERGLRTRNGSPFSDTTVDRLLRDPMAKGTRRANYTKSESSKKAWTLKPESEWVLQPVEPIVSEELWAECNAILDAQRGKPRRVAKITTHLFSGLTFCHCGNKMYVPTGSLKYTCFRKKCGNKITTDDMESSFHEQLRTFFYSPEQVNQLRAAAHASLAEKEALIGILQSEQQKLITESDKLYRLYQDDALDARGFRERNAPLAERLQQLDDELPKAQAACDVMKINFLSQEEVVTGARDLYTRWPLVPQEHRRRIVENIVEQIIVGTDDVEFELFYDLPPPTPPRASSSNGGGAPNGARKLATNEQRNLKGSLRI
jgi:site-specific DNA recombinase